MPLSNIKIKTAKPADKPYKITDEKGLYVLINTTGGKYWRWKYRVAGKEKLLALGVYPDVSLADARHARDEARKLHAKGIDPSQHKKASKAALQDALADSFEVVGLEWLQKRGAKSEGGDKRLHRLLKKDLFPYIGKRPVSEISAPELLKTLRKIEERGAISTAHRAKQIAGMVFRYAVATGRAQSDPSIDLKGALAQPVKTHFKAITKPTEVGKLISTIADYCGTPTVMAALKLSPLLFCRPGELRQLEWEEVSFEEVRIELPASKMKTKEPHIIPLCTQALEILQGLYLLTGRGKYVFPSARGASRPLSENGVRTALRTLGYTNEQLSPHGFRAMARTLLDEELNFRVDWIEHQLAHAVKDSNGRAYNRTKFLKGRRQMMQAWGDYLDKLRTDRNNVVFLKSAS